MPYKVVTISGASGLADFGKRLEEALDGVRTTPYTVVHPLHVDVAKLQAVIVAYTAVPDPDPENER